MNKEMNISVAEEICSYIFYLKNMAAQLLMYRRVYRNYFSVIRYKMRNAFPFRATLKDGTQVTLVNRYNAWYYTRIHGVKGIEYDTSNNITTISGLPYLADTKMQLKFYGAECAGDVAVVFFRDEYRNLPVGGKTVVDVGASIGDSAIYFSTRGADRVISLEPFPKFYEIAKKNIELNSLSDRITLLLAACGGNLGQITVDPELDSEFQSLRELKRGIRIPMLTLEGILRENNIRRGEGVLKMDCEGCEYDSILSASEDTLRTFSHIMIEYHYGYKNLKRKLEKSSFKVSVTRPYAEGIFMQNLRMGYIYAKQT